MIAPMSSTIASVSSNDFSDARRVRGGQREHAQGERDVGRHRHAPATGRRPSSDRHVHERRHDHPADRCERGQHRGPSIAQLAGDHLSLDLQPDEQEEECHQPVVDPEPEVLVERPRADAHRDARQPQLVVGVLPGRVGPQQRHDHRGEQQDRARGRGLQELLEGPEDDPGDGPVRTRPGGFHRRTQPDRASACRSRTYGSFLPTSLPGTPFARRHPNPRASRWPSRNLDTRFHGSTRGRW